MALDKITQVTGRAVCVPGDDIDTDRIIPARFMRCVTFNGLGEFLFYDVRFGPNKESKNHPLDRPEHQGATIVVSGENFGCGSSREHAPQALRKFGIRAVIAGGFAEIFFGNSTTLGMPCVSVAKSDREKIAAAIQADPKLEVTIDVAALKVRFGTQEVPCAIRDAARKALIDGQWDPIGQLLEGKEAVAKLAAALPY
jgi:3-isopropylmalate/(R)-2-methylmalate dehydratase small subunit